MTFSGSRDRSRGGAEKTLSLMLISAYSAPPRAIRLSLRISASASAVPSGASGGCFSRSPGVFIDIPCQHVERFVPAEHDVVVERRWSRPCGDGACLIDRVCVRIDPRGRRDLAQVLSRETRPDRRPRVSARGQGFAALRARRRLRVASGPYPCDGLLCEGRREWIPSRCYDRNGRTALETNSARHEGRFCTNGALPERRETGRTHERRKAQTARDT